MSKDDTRGFLVREAHVQKQLELLQQKYFEITTIKDVLIVQTAAEALAVMTRELEVHERYRNDAEAMIRRCEIRLGEITSRIPKGTTGKVRRGDITIENIRALMAEGRSLSAIAKQLGCSVTSINKRIAREKKQRRSETKGAVLRAAGIDSSRATKAERLARLPITEQERIVSEAKSLGHMYQLGGVDNGRGEVPRTFGRALLNELENRRIKPRDPVLDALQAKWIEMEKRWHPHASRDDMRRRKR